jgi:hypothetical protein
MFPFVKQYRKIKGWYVRIYRHKPKVDIGMDTKLPFLPSGNTIS